MAPPRASAMLAISLTTTDQALLLACAGAAAVLLLLGGSSRHTKTVGVGVITGITATVEAGGASSGRDVAE